MPFDVRLTFPPQTARDELLDARTLRSRGARELGLREAELGEVRPLRLSFDARRGRRRWEVLVRAWGSAEEAPAHPATRPPRIEPPPSDAPHVVVIGSGPAGLFAALDLLAAGVRVSLLERGRDVRTRRRALRSLLRGEPADPDSNYCFGEGGAGTYSDGKLYTRSGGKRAVRGVLERLVAHGAPPDILVDARPHVGSNRLPEVVRTLRESLIAGGADVRFGLRAETIEARGTSEPRVAAVLARELDSGELLRFEADACVLATGHSARAAVEMAARAGARLEPKGFAMGVRVEHAQAWLDERQYGGLRESCALPASYYQLNTTEEERGVYSFCMCPGGLIVPATTAPDRQVVNGMSLARRDSPFANAGLVVSLEPGDWCGERGEAWGFGELLAKAGEPGELPRHPDEDPLFGVRLQEALERLAARAGGGENRAPAERTDAFVEGARRAPVLPTSYRPGVRAVRLAEVLPKGITARLRAGLATFDRRLPGFVSEAGQCLGVESRTSSPVRIARDDESLEARGLARLYPAGEGAGYAGGIVSAALDGERVARAVARELVGA